MIFGERSGRSAADHRPGLRQQSASLVMVALPPLLFCPAHVQPSSVALYVAVRQSVLPALADVAQPPMLIR